MVARTDPSILERNAKKIGEKVRQGYAPPGTSVATGEINSTSAVADELGIKRGTFQKQVARMRKHGMDIFWGGSSHSAQKSAKTAEVTAEERLRERRLEQEVSSLKKREKVLLDQIITLQDARTSIFGLADSLDGPSKIVPKSSDGKGGRRCAILHISDVHAGESVDLHEMDGLNSYSGEICKARMQRLFQKTASLLTDHWNGNPVEEIIVCLGGDMIDNNLREESRRGGSMPVVESAKMISEIIAGGLIYLHEKVGAPIRIYTSPGNHGRLVQKPHANEGNIDNWDMMISWSIEKIIGVQDWVKFYYTGSGESLFSVMGWWFLLQHGHEGTGGTGGMYGPVYKQVRGMYRTHVSYARRGRGFHFVLQGHDHTASKIPFGFANGSVVGFNPYAMRLLKADPAPASQNLLIVERKLGVISWHELFLGTPDEGALYEPPEIDEGRMGKPVLRVKAKRS